MSGVVSKFLTIECPKLAGAIERMRSLNGEAPKAVARGMRGWGEETRTEAIRVTPKRFGNLRNTVYAKQDGTVLTIGAGGPAAPYAVAVHEHLSDYSPPSWRGHVDLNWTTPGTGPKYIENPIHERMPKLSASICAELDKEIEKLRSL